jgi:hypothetical protein
LVLTPIQDFLCILANITVFGSHSHGNILWNIVDVGNVITSVLNYTT